MRRQRIAARLLTAALMTMALATAAAPGVFFFAPDRRTAVYDLDVRVPDEALYPRDYKDTPYFDTPYYQFDIGNGRDFFCHFFYVDLGFGIKSYGLDYKLFTPGRKPVYYGRKFDVEHPRRRPRRTDHAHREWAASG
jgi:hypothetical protein